MEEHLGHTFLFSAHKKTQKRKLSLFVGLPLLSLAGSSTLILSHLLTDIRIYFVSIAQTDD